MCVYLYVNHHNIFYNSFNQNKAKNFKIYLSYTNKTCSLCCSPLFVTIVCSPLLLGGGRVEICMSPGLAQGPSPAQSIGRAGPSRQKSGDFYNGPGRQKRNEFFNYRALLQKKGRLILDGTWLFLNGRLYRPTRPVTRSHYFFVVFFAF